jgi:hypothetical protein
MYYVVILSQNLWGKKGQFGQNSIKSGQILQKDSQPRGLRFNSNEYDFLKPE